MVLVSVAVPLISPNLGEYINLSTTSTRLKNLLEEFTLWANLNIKRLHKNVITNITYLMNYVTVMLNKSLGKALIRLMMASATSLL